MRRVPPTQEVNDSSSAQSGAGEPSAQERFERISVALNTDIEQGRVEVERQGDAVVVRLASQGALSPVARICRTSFCRC